MDKNSRKKEEYEKFLVTLENLILTGVIKPRERLIEADLAQRLNVSRYLIRDGLKVLEGKGLVEIVPYKGAVVTDLGEKEIEDIFIMRVVLERLAIQLGLQNIRPADIKILKNWQDSLEIVTTTTTFKT